MLNIDNIIEIFSKNNVKFEFSEPENFIKSLEELVHYYDTMQRFIYYDYIYTDEEINSVDLICKNIEWKSKYHFLDQYLNPDKLIQSYFNYIPEKTADSLQFGFHIAKGYTPEVKLLKYDYKEDCNWHSDAWEKQLNVNWTRQLSSITFINDDYEGGQIEFECGAIVEPKKGKTVIFPSNWCFSYRDRPVTKGTKYLYVKHIWM